MYLNDHISIDNTLIDVEQSISIIAHLRNNLYQINNIEDFNKLRGDLSQFLFKTEGDIQTILNSFVQIQEVNRKYYDSYAIMKNNDIEMNQRLVSFERENSLLQERLLDYKKQNDYLININTNQEIYINELIGKLSNKERREYGAQMTRNPFTNSQYNINSSNSFNYDYNSNNNCDELKPYYTHETDHNKNKVKQISNINEIPQEQYDHQVLKSSLSINKEENSKENDIIIVRKESYSNKGNAEDINELNEKHNSIVPLMKIEQLYNNIHKKKEDTQPNKTNKTKTKDKESIKESLENNKEIEKSGEVLIKTRVQNIIFKVFKNDLLLSELKKQFGKNYIEKITEKTVNEEFVNKSEIAINNYETTFKLQHEKIKEIDEQLPIGKENLNKPQEDCNSALKSYFMYNLLQEKMLKNANNSY